MRYATDTAPHIRFDWETGLYKRWCLEARTEEELSRSFRAGREVFLLTLAAPDRNRQRLSVWLQTGLRAYDIAGVARPGLFAVLLPETDLAGVMGMLDRVLDAIDGLSWGVARFPDDGLTFETLLSRAAADMALGSLA